MMNLITNAQGFDFYTGKDNGEDVYTVVPDTQKAPLTGYPFPAVIIEELGLHPSMVKHFFKVD